MYSNYGLHYMVVVMEKLGVKCMVYKFSIMIPTTSPIKSRPGNAAPPTGNILTNTCCFLVFHISPTSSCASRDPPV